MSSAGSFLFNGQVPIAAPTGSDTTQQFPLWLQQAIYNSIGAASNAASQPYTPFPGPQVAQPSVDTQKAWQTAQQNVGNYQPYLNRAGALTAQGGSQITPQDVQGFLNPYQSYITGALNRNLMDTLLPSIQDRFVSAGQSRSPQEAQITSNAIRGTQEAVGESLAQNYQGALSTMQAERQRELGAGAQFGNLGTTAAQLGVGDVSQLATAGGQQDALAQANINAAMNNFNQQRDYPYQQVGFLSNIIRGLPVQAAGSSTQTVGTTYPTSYGPSPYASLLGAYGQNTSGLGFRRGGHVAGALRRKSTKSTRPSGALKKAA